MNDAAYTLDGQLDATIPGGGNGRIVKLDRSANPVTVTLRDGSGTDTYVLRGQGDEFTFHAGAPAQIVVTAETYPASILLNLTGQPGLLSTPLANTGGALVEHWGEIPAGDIDGVNRVYTLTEAPNPSTSLMLYRDGLQMRPGGNDYRLAGNVITFEPGNAPEYDAVMTANYTA